MKKIIFTVVLTFAMNGQASLVCRGQVATGNYASEISINLSALDIGSKFSLANPITLDSEQEIEMQIVNKVTKNKSTLVEARYTQLDNSLMSFIIKKDSDGRVHLLKLQGHEDNQTFGPGHLICEAQK
ncbi:MAG: hypothetical protein ACXVCP_19885 [Bdellovibrio sp.]